MRRHPRRQIQALLSYLLAVFAPSIATAESIPPQCGEKVQQILHGNLSIGSITNVTIRNPFYIYYGSVPGLDDSVLREDYLALTYEGCLAICGDGTIAPNSTQTALSIAATWIFPLAILLSLPYEAGSGRKLQKLQTILVSVSNWLGSPQTSLAAAVWNFRQTESCQSRIRDILQRLPKGTGGKEDDQTLLDALYVLSCFNQFDLRPKAGMPAEDAVDLGDLEVETDGNLLLRTMIYGLFRPISASPKAPPAAPAPRRRLRAAGQLRRAYNQEFQIKGLAWSPENEQRITRNLLNTLAHKLRMHRRRGVVPILANLAVFLLAYIFSIVLAFSDLGENTTVFVLDLALLFSWLPVLVVFAIVDRNPVSSTHQAVLMTRWLYNVLAVREWSVSQGVGDYFWWHPELEDAAEPLKKVLKVGDFIGQGRRLHYCGLTHAILKETQPSKDPDGRHRFPVIDEWDSDAPENIATAIGAPSPPPRPGPWHMIMVVCLFVVWIEILMAFYFDFITPPVGPGCWSLMFLLYGCLSMPTWVLSFWEPRRENLRVVRRWISHTFNTLAIGWMVFVIIMLVTGQLMNCYCNACMPGRAAGYGGYMDFETFEFYRDKFNLRYQWMVGVIFGSIVPGGAFFLAWFWWLKSKDLWHADENRRVGDTELEGLMGPGLVIWNR